MARSMRMALLAFLAAAVALVVVPVAAAWGGGGTTSNTFSGRATVFAVDVLGIETTAVDTGEVSPSGDTLEEGAACYPSTPTHPDCPGVPDITGGLVESATVPHAMVVAQGNQSTAEASVAEFTIPTDFGPGEALLIGGGGEARATATCTNGVASVSGATTISSLFVAGSSVVITGAANQVVPVPGGGTIIVNEQAGSASGNTGDITVTALHIILPGVLDLRIGRAHADIRCGTGTPSPCPRKFGGSGSSSKVKFAIAAAEDDQAWGHVLVSQKDIGLKVSATPASVSAYANPT